MTDEGLADASTRGGALEALTELIEALDRRVPHVERLGEIRIAREAAALRHEALMRIEQLKAAEPDRRAREAGLAGDVMADEGEPLRKK